MARRKRKSFGYSKSTHRLLAKHAGGEAKKFLRRARSADTCREAINALSKGTFWLGIYKSDRRGATANTKKPLSTNVGRIAIASMNRVISKCSR